MEAWANRRVKWDEDSNHKRGVKHKSIKLKEGMEYDEITDERWESIKTRTKGIIYRKESNRRDR